jgi:hypothetical protein
MHKVDQKLAEWTQAYEQLKAAQAKVKQAGTKPTVEMREEVERLQRKADLALKDLQSEFEAAKQRNAA